MIKKLFTAAAIAATLGVSLTACTNPVDEPAPTPAPDPVVVEEKATAVPLEEYIDFADASSEATYDGVSVVCAVNESGSEATSARVVPADASDTSAIAGETSHFLVACAYPATDEIMSAIEELNKPQG